MKQKQKWKFIGRDANGWLGFRCIAGPGSLFSDGWAGDYYIEPTQFWIATGRTAL